MTCKHCGHNEYYIDGTFTRWVNSDHNTELTMIHQNLDSIPLKITGELPAKCGECEKAWEESK